MDRDNEMVTDNETLIRERRRCAYECVVECRSSTCWVDEPSFSFRDSWLAQKRLAHKLTDE